MIIDSRPPTPTNRSLDRALRVVDEGPKAFGRAAAVSLAVTSVLTILISLYERPHRGIPVQQRDMIEAGVLALCVIAVLGLISLAWPAASRAATIDRLAPPEVRAAVWLALTAWFPFLLIGVYFLARSTFPLTVHWLAFGFEDKRWVTSFYLAAALAPMLLFVAAARVLQAGREHPRTWRAWLVGLVPRRAQAEVASVRITPGTVARIGAAIGTAVGLAYYFYGPPWYLSQNHGNINFQEDVFLQGFQGIFAGHVPPYIGPAAEQYGPGAEFLSYLYMRHIGTFSIVGFRESWAVFQWVGATVLFLVFFLALGYGRGLAASLLSALIYPALQLIHFVPGGVYNGFWGWANPLRYAGAIGLILLLPAVIRRCPSWRGLAGGAVIGVLFGGLCYMAQENLIAGAVGALAVGTLLLLTGTSTWRSVVSAWATALAGFLLVWIPILGFYAVEGVLSRFLYLYFMTPKAVAGGYGNTPFGGFSHGGLTAASARPWDHMFYLLPVVLAVIALLSVVEYRPFRVAQDWSRERILLVSITVTTILLYQGALLRSDSPHLAGTLEAVPAFVVTIATVLPRLLGLRYRTPLILVGAVLVAVSFLLLPYSSFSPSKVRGELEAPYLDRVRLAATHTPATPTTLAGQRVGAGLAEGIECCQFAYTSMPTFIQLMNHLHAIIGTRTTYVADFPDGYPGVIYFVADLNPAPIPLEPHTMVFNVPQRTAYLKYFKSNVLPHTQALVTSSLRAVEAKYFIHRYPKAREVALTYQGAPYYVLLSTGHLGKQV